MKALHSYLDRIYYDSTSGGAFSSPSKLLHEVKRRGYYHNVGIRRISHYLNKQSAYTLYKPAKTRFPTPPVYVTSMNQQFDMDLMDTSRYASENDGVRYLLSAVDVLSKYGFLIPLKSKEARAVAQAAIEIFDERKPESVCTDLGSEFRRLFKEVCAERGIRHFYAGGSGHASIAERFHRTMRTRIARYQYKHNTMRYIDALPALVQSYNRSFHRSIQMRPVDVTPQNDHIAYDNLYGHRQKVKRVPFQLKVGDTVRISGVKHPFRREFFQKWSVELFTVSRRWRQRGVNMYKIKDCSGSEIVGTFYAPELAKVTTSPEDMFRVEKFLDEKVENGQSYVKVQWEGYPKACSTWVLKNSVKST